MARYADPNNYVYISLRRSNTVTLRKVQNGTTYRSAAQRLRDAQPWYRFDSKPWGARYARM